MIKNSTEFYKHKGGDIKIEMERKVYNQLFNYIYTLAASQNIYTIECSENSVHIKFQTNFNFLNYVFL